ncbi:carbohydrate-binding family 9-like protein [Paenibacillus macquariensis]|uniref:Carbohydrate family 9 binding domain-like n=1 Tax=Paenibacillus macquariensis TaxID=948756 RepID=A0ABY1K6D8_9BACL|nr:carbohydrate-binding family 9-like protein [Paenibacillus macquariensis]MEC0093581.1 carbohydrate-binding family 9-like protein [Paenibacillus macquariensis]SIR32867.1 Carbohydrate family 9 binding domain-like [Paenibacillus macquariensis]
MNSSGVMEPNIEYAPKHYICRRATESLVLDGRVDKSFWAGADWTDDFVDIEGDLRPKPTKQTRVKMMWDDEYFYFAAELIEDQIWATLTEREAVIFYDNDFEIFIDPDGDTHQYYEFEVNALNTVWDLMLVKPYRDGGPPVNAWDINGLKTAVHIDGELNRPDADNRKWSVEVAMPWTSLRECAPEGRPPVKDEFWRVNFSRVQWRTEVKDGEYTKILNPDTGKPFPEDNWVWSPMGIINMHYPELWGYVVFADKEGPEQFEPSPDERMKWELRKLYYRERNYFAEHGEFTTDVKMLMGDESWIITPTIELTSRLFQISAPSSDGTATIYIREDGKLWKE